MSREEVTVTDAEAETALEQLREALRKAKAVQVTRAIENLLDAGTLVVEEMTPSQAKAVLEKSLGPQLWEREPRRTGPSLVFPVGRTLTSKEKLAALLDVIYHYYVLPSKLLKAWKDELETQRQLTPLVFASPSEGKARAEHHIPPHGTVAHIADIISQLRKEL
jgi:hypothetical protein